MKKFLTSLLGLFIFGGVALGMEMEEVSSQIVEEEIPSQVVEVKEPGVEVYFASQQNKNLSDALLNVLSNATSQVLVASYWITHSPILTKLFELKKNGIDVQIIFDESVSDLYKLPSSTTSSLNEFIDQFLNYDNFEKLVNKKSMNMPEIDKFVQDSIVPIIYPSKMVQKPTVGLMHHKFIVVDGKIVCTGSANFTGTVFSSSEYFNYENMIKINSKDIAIQYKTVFDDIKKDIFELYINIIAFVPDDVNRLPKWLRLLTTALYYGNKTFQDMLLSNLEKLDPLQQEKLWECFSSMESDSQGPSDIQKHILSEKRVSTAGMSKKVAFKLIGLTKGKKRPVEQSSEQLHKKPRTE